ncbi:MAG: hypothetical protein AAGE01_24225 [Pseudomonadota bacterium]
MTTKKQTNAPETTQLDDEALDEISGGIGPGSSGRTAGRGRPGDAGRSRELLDYEWIAKPNLGVPDVLPS